MRMKSWKMEGENFQDESENEDSVIEPYTKEHSDFSN
jgi:hypothetical protein